MCLVLLSIVGKAQCVSDTVKTTCGNAILSFERQWYDTGQQLAFVHVHENETTALQAATWLMDSVRQGSVTTWHAQQQRFVDFSIGSRNFRFDPNRIYTQTGIRLTLGTDATDTAVAAVQAVADTFLRQFVVGKSLIVAVHNNTDKGGLSVTSYEQGGIYCKDAKAVYRNPLFDADDFFYTTEERYFNYLKRKKYNVVLQNNNAVTDDGSLSVFCARQSIAYLNVEAQNDHLQQQKEMLRIIWQILESESQNAFSETKH